MPKQPIHQTSHQEAAGVTVGEFIRPARPAMIATGLPTALGALLSIVPFEAVRNLAAIWLGEILPQGQRGNPWAWAVIAVGTLFASQALRLAGLGITHLAGARLHHHLREWVVEAISGLPLGRVRQIPHGTIRKMVCDDTTSIHTLVAHVPGDTTNAVVMAVAGTAYLLWTDRRLVCALVGLWVLVLGTMLLAMSGMSDTIEHFGAAQTALTVAAAEILEGIKEIKGFQTTDASCTRFNQARTEFSSLSYEWASRPGKAVSAMTAVLRLSTVFATVALLAVLFTFQGQTSLSATLLFFLVTLGLPEGLMTLIGLMQHMYESRMAAQTTANLLSLPPMPEGAHDGGERPTPRRVDVEDVTLSYETGSSVLHSTSFTAEPGAVIAPIGLPGGGKSTLVRPIARFYDVDDRAVRISGADVHGVTFPWLLSRVAVVLQDVALAHESVHDNIALGRPEAAREQAEAAARAACIHKRIVRLPYGYDTILSEEGGFLSGEKRQRVTLARAYLQDAPVLVLDEATVQTDPTSERDIHQALSRLAAGRTVIIIAYRLSTIHDADQILVVDAGRITERDMHEKLLAAGRRYAAMQRSQDLSEETDAAALAVQVDQLRAESAGQEEK